MSLRYTTNPFLTATDPAPIRAAVAWADNYDGSHGPVLKLSQVGIPWNTLLIFIRAFAQPMELTIYFIQGRTSYWTEWRVLADARTTCGIS